MLKFPKLSILKMFSENHYRPLPKEIIIKQSEIDGYGIFAKEKERSVKRQLSGPQSEEKKKEI